MLSTHGGWQANAGQGKETGRDHSGRSKLHAISFWQPSPPMVPNITKL
jgi:hypothetical protein